jgi:hypothetical protein
MYPDFLLAWLVRASFCHDFVGNVERTPKPAIAQSSYQQLEASSKFAHDIIMTGVSMNKEPTGGYGSCLPDLESGRFKDLSKHNAHT